MLQTMMCPRGAHVCSVDHRMSMGSPHMCAADHRMSMGAHACVLQTTWGAHVCTADHGVSTETHSMRLYSTVCPWAAFEGKWEELIRCQVCCSWGPETGVGSRWSGGAPKGGNPGDWGALSAHHRCSSVSKEEAVGGNFIWVSYVIGRDSGASRGVRQQAAGVGSRADA